MLALPIQVMLSLLVVVAAVADLHSRRIPNWLTLPALPLGITAQALYGDGFWQGLLGALAGFVALFPVFIAGGGGAGDVKLFAAVGAFVGLKNIVVVFVLVAVIGGFAAIVVAVRAGALTRVLRSTGAILASILGRRWNEVKQQSDLDQPGKMSLPYGAVIAAGTLLFVWLPR